MSIQIERSAVYYFVLQYPNSCTSAHILSDTYMYDVLCWPYWKSYHVNSHKSNTGISCASTTRKSHLVTVYRHRANLSRYTRISVSNFRVIGLTDRGRDSNHGLPVNIDVLIYERSFFHFHVNYFALMYELYLSY